MVIDEHTEKASTPEEKEPEQSKSVENVSSETVHSSDEKSPKQSGVHVGSTEDEDEECPIFSIYSSTSREFSQKEEEEREREIAAEKRKLEEMELLDKKSNAEDELIEEEVAENMKKLECTGAGSDLSTEAAAAEKDSGEKAGGKKPFKADKEERNEQAKGRRSRSDQCSDGGMPFEDQGRSPVGTSSTAAESRSPESEKVELDKTPSSTRDKSSSEERSPEKIVRRQSQLCDYDSDVDSKKVHSDDDDDDDKRKVIEVGDKLESESESLQTKVTTGLEGLDVEEVSSDNGDGDEFIERSLSSLSLSELSNRSKESPSRLKKKRKKKRRKGFRKGDKKHEEGDGEGSAKEKDKSDDGDKIDKEDIENEGQVDKRKRRKSKSVESDRQILGTKENKKDKGKEKDKDLSWKKPSKKEKIYREGKRRSKERGRSRSKERRKSKSLSPKKDKKKSKDRKKKSERKKDIERYDVRKIVKNKEIRKTDAFGRDILSKSRSISRSRSRSPVRERSRNMLRRDSRSYSRSRSRSYRRGRSPIRRRYLRSRTKSRSKSLRRSFSRSRSRSRSPRKSKKKFKSKDRLKGRSRSRGRKSRSRRRSLTRSRSRSPLPRMARGKRPRSRRSWSHHSRSLSFSPRRSRSISRTPIRVRRSYSRSVSSSWSRGRSAIPRASSLEKLTVVLKTKDKKKGKKKKEGKRAKRDEDRRKKVGNSKEVFASGDNVLVSVNFRNNNIASSNNNNGSASNETTRTRLDSMSPTPSSDRKRKRGSDYEIEKVSKKTKKSNAISKNVVDMALSNSCTKRAKKLTRLSEKDAEVILNRKPVAVIDLDMSPYREQTPSPINVVVVSDSGSGDEGKEQTPQRPNPHATSGFEPEKNQEIADTQSATVSVPGSPVANGYLTGPKTPPEPQIKFSIAKPPQLRQIANPLGDDDDDDDDVGEDDDEQEFKRIESLDRRIEKELDASHKGPNTPPEPRGPTTPKTPPSPQTSPDAYDPFEPTKSRSPTPAQDKDIGQTLSTEQDADQQVALASEASTGAPSNDADKVGPEVALDIQEEKKIGDVSDKGDALPAADAAAAAPVTAQPACTPLSEPRKEDSPERKTPVAAKQTTVPPATSSTLTSASGGATPFASFSVPSPTKTTRTATATAAQPLQVSGIQRLQHRLGSPVNRTPNSVKTTPEKRSTPRTDSNDVAPPGNYRATKRNGEQTKQPRPLQDATNETVDSAADMEDSPYSPASSEGDDLFDPPLEPTKPTQTNPKVIQPGYKPPPSKTPHKSPIKQLSKFDLLFGPSGPALSPLKVANKKPKSNPKPSVPAKPSNPKTAAVAAAATKKNSGKRGISLKMDEDQLRILDELPSSAVELQVKDKFLKKLNRQERVVDEVKTVLKPHYARKHITKEEYKDILRRSVPKICHSRSGEINPSKIQSLIEAYVRKFRHAKKKGSGNSVAKAKVK
ncbi:UNVERIFIED_CONTAM: hypothetical protein PYX00_004122 [Menopon gallinae]|uniref:SFR19-like C-terminal domain-containing protein n=1 Tax=Menopon gallinae TaxID=328185 RepID=A0AAW2I3C4_9NEOP